MYLCNMDKYHEGKAGKECSVGTFHGVSNKAN